MGRIVTGDWFEDSMFWLSILCVAGLLFSFFRDDGEVQGQSGDGIQQAAAQAQAAAKHVKTKGYVPCLVIAPHVQALAGRVF